MSWQTHTRSPRAARRGRVITWCVIAWGLAMSGACRDRPKPAQDPVPLGPTVQLSLDGATRTVEVTRTIALADLVAAPPAAWLEVRADAPDGRFFEVPTPTTTYPGSELRLGVDRGRITIGVFPPVTADMSSEVAARARHPLVSLTTVASVEVVTRRTSTLPPLVIEVDGRPHALTGDQLATLPGVSKGTARAQGWPLDAVIALAVRDRPARELRLVGAQEVTLTAHELRDPTKLFVLKANQRGEYVFRMWDIDGRRPTREVRRVTKIVVD